jgi:hypothetical protein
MQARTPVIGVLRTFFDDFVQTHPRLHPAAKRALWAMERCRTAQLGWSRHRCEKCEHSVFTYHSCNHRSCPQCGKQATAQWVQGQFQKQIPAPYFLVTFTLPSQLRAAFQSRHAKSMFALFFEAASAALSQTLANPKWLGATHNGFIMVLHTWNQQLHFHPHIHALVPAAGLDSKGNLVCAKWKDYLLPVRALQKAFRGQFHSRFLLLRSTHTDLQLPDPSVWSTQWGVHLQSAGDGRSAIKYLARYVCKTAIGDSRMREQDGQNVSFQWTDRAHGNASKTLCIAGVEFVRRFLLHVLPQGLRSIRYYGFLHPAGKIRFQTISFLCGNALFTPAECKPNTPEKPPITCPCCGNALRLVEVMRNANPIHPYLHIARARDGPDP